MSYDVYLNEPDTDNTMTVSTRGIGGTYAVLSEGASYFDAWLNVTYNYSKIWGVYDIDGMTGAESISVLEAVVEENGTEQDGDYWNATPGNVGHMANTLLSWAREHPEGVWSVH